MPYDPKDEILVLTKLMPADLLGSGVILSHESSSRQDVAIKVVKWAAEAGWPIFGVEIWHKVDDSPEWIATSNYQVTKGDRFSRAVASSEYAEKFILSYCDDPLALFNMTWDLEESDSRHCPRPY